MDINLKYKETNNETMAKKQICSSSTKAYYYIVILEDRHIDIEITLFSDEKKSNRIC